MADFSLDLWLQWLDDEEQTADSQETVYGVYELYARAVSDYLCIAPLSGMSQLIFSHKHLVTLS